MIIDCAVELFMHHWPIGSIITIIFLVISGMILAIQFYRLKNNIVNKYNKKTLSTKIFYR